jgi:hypothetical protein
MDVFNSIHVMHPIVIINKYIEDRGSIIHNISYSQSKMYLGQYISTRKDYHLALTYKYETVYNLYTIC